MRLAAGVDLIFGSDNSHHDVIKRTTQMVNHLAGKQTEPRIVGQFETDPLPNQARLVFANAVFLITSKFSRSLSLIAKFRPFSRTFGKGSKNFWTMASRVWMWSRAR